MVLSTSFGGTPEGILIILPPSAVRRTKEWPRTVSQSVASQQQKHRSVRALLACSLVLVPIGYSSVLANLLLDSAAVYAAMGTQDLGRPSLSASCLIVERRSPKP